MNKQSVSRQKIFQYAKENFDTTPQYLWEKYPNYAVFKHTHNQKWFGIIVDLPYTKLNLSHPSDPNGCIDLLVIKADPAAIPTLLNNDGYHPAYHMNKTHWISLRLDGTIPEDEIYYLLNESYQLTKK
ncbi:MAG: MmcQ/YjbR family DNA-binding protein [Peptococcaceae bacterium]|nr:MmcQ/YjbR family DNA-binding protein [Peptococcaceae bacterium]